MSINNIPLIYEELGGGKETDICIARKLQVLLRVVWDILQLTIWKFCHSGQKACCYGDKIAASLDNLVFVRIGRNFERGAAGGFHVGVY